jgi:hypothetical protein
MNRSYRQKVLQEYLNSTGRNTFQPAEFLAWLEPQPEHRVWHVFFGKNDADAAREYRIGLVRSFISGLRVRYTVTEFDAKGAEHIRLAVAEPTVIQLPAYVSPANRRRDGGGYVATDVNDSTSMAELFQQGADDLSRWLERYGGAARLAGADVTAVAALVGTLTAAAIPPEEAA